MAEISEIKRFLLSLSDREILLLLKQENSKPTSVQEKSPDANGYWFDEQICGLSEDGLKVLRGLEALAARTPASSHLVDRKQLRYIRALKNMKLEVPDFFRETANPRALYKRLVGFCTEHDIPEEIAGRIVPALVTYIETGHMRPVIFVGEKGCGKTTAVRMLVEEALRIPTEIIKVPQTDGGHGMTGDCATYQSADVGCIAKARLRANSLIVAYIFDEIDKVTHERNRASVDDELLSITDESCSSVYDNYLETTLVALEHCPMFFTANDLQKVNPILADRCMVIHFPNASASRIKSISKKFADAKLQSDLYSTISFNYELMNKSIDNLVSQNVTSLRKHQQMIEAVLENALNIALTQDSDGVTVVTEAMFKAAEETVLGAVKRKVGFNI